MGAAETIALVRDVMLIVASLVMIVVLLSILGIALKLYSRTKPIINNLQRSTSIIHNVISQPLSLIGGVVELLNRGMEMLGQIRKRERREEDGEVQ
jgi:cell shape-determining protein MreC